MNLPEVITFTGGREIVYVYDASGAKLSKKTYVNGSLGVTTEYSAGFVYENGSLDYFGFSEGRIRKITPIISESYQYEYDLTDHLGNVRATFKAIEGYDYDTHNTVYGLALIQADDYYPFGLKMPDYSFVASGADENKFTYNGKELEDEFGLNWYHYGARFYDPTVGRWWAVDPADEFNSPYNYVGSNPIIFVDPNGAFSEQVAGNCIPYCGALLTVAKFKMTDTFNRAKEWVSSKELNVEGTIKMDVGGQIAFNLDRVFGFKADLGSGEILRYDFDLSLSTTFFEYSDDITIRILDEFHGLGDGYDVFEQKAGISVPFSSLELYHTFNSRSDFKAPFPHLWINNQEVGMNAKFGPIIGTNSNLHYNFDKGYGGNISPFNVSGEAGVGVIGNVNIDFLIEDKK